MEKLFTEFKPTTAADWKNQLTKELKGEDYNSLRWQNENGFTIEPFYTAEDLKQNYSPAFEHSDWEICVKAKPGSDKEVNEQLLADLNRGASSISLHCNHHNPEETLKGVSLKHIHSSFFVNNQNASALIDYLKSNEPAELHSTLFTEEFASLTDLENWNKKVEELQSHANIKTMAFDALPYHNQNCLAEYEVAIILSALVEWLEFYSDKKLPAADIVIKTGVHADYFVQMAKLRAIRRLWEVIKKEYNISNSLHLIVETSSVNKSISDSYNNLLRTTVEAMAAVSGGCNELIINGFDLFFATNNELSERMAINQHLVLKNESYLDKMADVACGSYYIETLTDTLAAKALETFKTFEKEGGYFKCLEKEIFNKEISQQANARNEEFNSLKRLAIGVNKFKNEKEKIELTEAQIKSLEVSGINNPVLNYELKNFFNHA